MARKRDLHALDPTERVLPSMSVNRNVVTPDEAFTSVRLEYLLSKV